LLVCCVTNAACPRTDSLPDQEAAPLLALGGQAQAQEERPNYDIKPRRVDLIPPGTVIAKEAPKGWSHLIIKSRPTSTCGDTKKLPAISQKLCTMLFTAMVANVKAEKSGDKLHHRLSGLAVGLGTPVGDKDTVISPDTYQRLGAKLPLFGAQVLSEAHAKLKDILIVARSDGMAVVDGPGYLLRGDKHVPIILRYAMLVNPATGELDTLLLPIERDAKGNYKGAIGSLQWLPKSKVEDYALHVNGKEISSFGIPSDTAFAMNKMISGRKDIPLADGFKANAVKARLTADEAYDLETKLRDALKKAAK